ncbi:MAG: class I SAM-dependent methyltransferase [Acidobacteriota bacterium]|nr:class I SAM-dependent methyltransferase [Acidobacteriota bacterium]
MTRLASAWRKFHWSLLHLGSLATLRALFERAQRAAGSRGISAPHAAASIHPFDLRHGVETSGLIGGADLQSGHRNDIYNTAYYGMAPSRFRWILDFWIDDCTHSSIEQYTFVDLGCGKGRAVMMASEFPFLEVIGVELHPGLAGTARQNVALWQRTHPASATMRILHQDATEFIFPAGPCLLYLFNPFAAPVVDRLIDNIEAQFADRPGTLDLIYFNPECGDLLDARPGFELLWSGTVPLSQEDAAVDSVASPEDLCSVYRWTGTSARC